MFTPGAAADSRRVEFGSQGAFVCLFVCLFCVGGVRMGVAVCRHLRRVERVVLGYLEVRDPPEETSRLKILETLQRTIRTAWPRLEHTHTHTHTHTH